MTRSLKFSMFLQLLFSNQIILSPHGRQVMRRKKKSVRLLESSG